MRVVRAPSSHHDTLSRQAGQSLPPKLLDKAVSRLCFITIISAVSTVLFFIADGFLQPEVTELQKHPVIRLLALSMVLLSFAFFGLHTVLWLVRSVYLYLHDSKSFREAKVQAHVDRFYRSAHVIRIALPYTKTELCQLIVETTRRSGLMDAYVQCIATRGFRSSAPIDQWKPSTIILGLG